MPSLSAVGLEIEAHVRVWGNQNILVQNRPAQLCVPPDVAVVHDHATFDDGAGVDSDPASQNRFANQSSRENAPSRHDAVERLASSPVLVEYEFRRRIRVARAAYRPLAVIEIEFWL